jgi:hypothetical protein
MISKNLLMGIENCSSGHTLIFGGYVKVRESLYTRGVIWVNTILNPIDTRAILPRYEGPCMVSRTKISSNTHTLLVVKEDDTRPTLV